jgi:CMP/dCMP kinase
MILTFCGKPGSGKNSVANLLSEKLKMKMYVAGDMMRDIARKKGMDIDEFGKLCEKDASYDKMLDEYIEELGEKKDNFIMVSRTAFYFIPRSVKIFLEVNLDEAARRRFNETKKNREKRNEREYRKIDDVKKEIKERMQSETKRYKKYYKIDCYDLSNYDLIIDTSKISIEQVAEKIVKYLKSNNLLAKHKIRG